MTRRFLKVGVAFGVGFPANRRKFTRTFAQLLDAEPQSRPINTQLCLGSSGLEAGSWLDGGEFGLSVKSWPLRDAPAATGQRAKKVPRFLRPGFH